MGCTEAYREALTRDLSSTASSAPALAPAPAPTPAPTPTQRQAAEAGRAAPAGRPLRRRTNPGPDDLDSRDVAAAVAESGPAVALARDATVVNGEVIDQR